MTRTRVIVLMFHRVNDASLNHSPVQFANYLNYLVQNFPIVLPGDPIPDDVPLAICLTFDDAYFDFYHNVYPLLQQHQIKALLAVPVKYIVENTTLSTQTRLSVPYAHDMEDPSYATKVPFCTWEELREMAQSPNVVIASHGFRHANLSDRKVDLSQEITISQAILQLKLNQPVQHFVYPFGRTSNLARKKIQETYDYGLRIGGALNYKWNEKTRFLYRINADPLWTQHIPIHPALVKKLTFKYWLNRLRDK